MKVLQRMMQRVLVCCPALLFFLFSCWVVVFAQMEGGASLQGGICVDFHSRTWRRVFKISVWQLPCTLLQSADVLQEVC